MNILIFGKGHKFIQIISPEQYFYRFKCENCNLRISQRKDAPEIYGITMSEVFHYECDSFKNWEELTCNETIIKNIIA